VYEFIIIIIIIKAIMNTQAVLNVYVNCLDDLLLYELKNNMQLDLNTSHKKTLLSSESIFISQSSRLTSFVFDVILSNKAVNIITCN